MSELLNQHSYLAVALLSFGGLWFVLRRRGRWLRAAAMLGVTALLALAFAALRPGTGDIRTPGDLDAALAGGRPVVLDFFSNY